MHKSDLITSKNLLKKGEVIIFPTETVFGIGADATNSIAINRIYSIKKRPKNNPLICLFKNLTEVKKHFQMNELELKLARLYWPGPLTLILTKKDSSCDRRIWLCWKQTSGTAGAGDQPLEAGSDRRQSSPRTGPQHRLLPQERL